MTCLMRPPIFLMIISIWKPKSKQKHQGTPRCHSFHCHHGPGTESQSSRAYKQPLRSRPSNKIKVLLDSGSDGALYFLQKGKDKPFPYLTRQVPKSWRTSNGSFQTPGQGKIRVKFFDYSNSREYFLQPDVVEYKESSLTKPGFDLILGSNTLKELGIVLDFRTREITLDDISLPMRDINS